MLALEDIPVSTKTIIASSNLEIDIEKVFQTFPISEEPLKDENSIYFQTMYFGNEIRGQMDKKRRKLSFRNAINVIGLMPNQKRINFKVSKNGKFQLTGCKEDQHAFTVVEQFIQRMRLYCPSDCLHRKEDDIHIRISFKTVMTNIDFSLGFLINRLKLDELINKHTQIYSLLETSCGYTGVNIKFPVQYAYWKDPIPLLVCEWNPHHVPFRKSLSMCHDPISAMPTKQRYNTFLVFHSGNVIMSGMNLCSMKEHFIEFQKMILEWKPMIEEKIV